MFHIDPHRFWFLNTTILSGQSNIGGFLRTIGGFHLPRQRWKHWTVGAIFNHQADFLAARYCLLPQCPLIYAPKKPSADELSSHFCLCANETAQGMHRHPGGLWCSQGLTICCKRDAGSAHWTLHRKKSSSTGRFQLGIFLSGSAWW